MKQVTAILGAVMLVIGLTACNPERNLFGENSEAEETGDSSPETTEVEEDAAPETTEQTGDSSPETTVEESPQTTESSPAPEDESVDPVTGLPLLSGGDPAQPDVGDQDSQDPVVGQVKSWTEAVQRMREEAPWYATCTDERIDISLEDAEKYADLESEYDLRFILIVNSTISDDQARDALKEEGFEMLDKLKVKRINMIRNTRRTHVGGDNNCQAFLDSRPQVRISLGIPVFDPEDETKVIGLADDRGLMGHCGNPWDVPPPPPPTRQTPPPGTKPPVTTVPPGTSVPPTTPPGTSVPTTTPPVTTVPPGTVPPTTLVCGDKAARLPDGTCGVTDTTTPRSPVTVPTTTVVHTVPPTAPSDTLPPGVTPTTWDYVPTPSTIQLPDGPPVTATPPTTVAPPVTTPTNTGGVVCPPHRQPCA